MDLETENRLAALLMEEARRLRMQAEKEGVHAYLRKPNVRTRPNSRFLTATVLGVQQANRAVEVREMWHARAKEIEIEAKHHSRSREERYSGRSEKHHHGSFRRSRQQRNDGDSAISCSSNKMGPEDHYSSEDGSLRDDEVEEFLQSRAKRGRGAIGSRMDEPGPYPSSTASGQGGVNSEERLKGVAECRTFGPEKPSFFRSDESHKGNSSGHVSGNDTCSSGKHHSKENDTCSLWRHHSKEKRRKKDKSDGAKRKKHKSKHHRKSRRID